MSFIECRILVLFRFFLSFPPVVAAHKLFQFRGCDHGAPQKHPRNDNIAGCFHKRMGKGKGIQRFKGTGGFGDMHACLGQLLHRRLQFDGKIFKNGDFLC